MRKVDEYFAVHKSVEDGLWGEILVAIQGVPGDWEIRLWGAVFQDLLR